MKRFVLTILIVLAVGAGTLLAGEPKPEISDIVVDGGVTVTTDTVEYYLGLEPGDPFDLTVINEGFHRLWDSGLFENLRIDKEEEPDGTIKLIVVVKERPFVRSVLFEGNKKLSTSDIKDKLDQVGIELPRNVPLRIAELDRIKSALKELYKANGYLSAKIDYTIEDLTKNEKQVTFHIDEGAKVKIERVEFEGNTVFSDGKLRHVLKKTKETHWYRPWGKKIIYNEAAWEEDQKTLRDFYMDHGYKDIKIGKPRIELIAKHPEAEELKKKKYRVKVVVPIEEGERFKVGKVTVHGTKVFKEKQLERLFRVTTGKWYSQKVIKGGLDAIQNMYHNRGYVYAYANQVLENDPKADHVVNVTIEVFEGDRYRLGRLEFKGNTKTRDKVIRRQFILGEGSWMNMGSFKRSVYKVNALGFWKLEDDPLEFTFDDEKKRVNVNVKGHEVGRNDLQFGAGYSELDGFFAQMMFNTRNFLGRGETLGVSLQTGRRSDYYTLSFSEPYFLDKRILLGASIFSTNLDVADFYRETKGGSFTLGFGLGPFDSITTLFAYEDVTSRYAVVRMGFPGDPTGGHQRPIDLPPPFYEEPERTYEVFKGTTASFTPAYVYDSRDDPFDPNRGRRFVSRIRFAGGVLGGDYDYVRPEVTFTNFHPLTRRTIFAYNVAAGQFFTYHGSEIPIYERYRLGGDRSLRGIPYYTVVPRTKEGEYFLTPGGSRLGGDRYWLTNFEYQIRLGGPVKLVLFADLGNTYHEDQGWDFSLFRKTTGVEIRIFLPIFQAPIRFIYGINLDPFPDEKSSDFQFSIGTTF